MRILIVDKTTEGQALLADRIKGFDAADKDALDISVLLAGEKNYLERMCESDVLIFGSGLQDYARSMAPQAKAAAPSVHIIMFVTDQAYSSGAFREAHVARVRKVIPNCASSLDLLQELVNIQEEFRAVGKARKGNLVVVAQAKGGVGATTLCAALGEVCSESGRNTMLWDLDIETKDLCRGLGANGPGQEIVTGWVNGTAVVSRESLKSAVVPVGDNISMLMPPHMLAASMDYLGHPDTLSLVQRVAELARVTHDNIIVDMAGRVGPASGLLLRLADEVVLVIDDSVLGLTGIYAFLSGVLPVIKNHNALRFVCSGTRLSVSEMAKEVGKEFAFGPRAWSLPPIPFDSSGGRWAGSGKTLYSLGQRPTRKVLLTIAEDLGLIGTARAPLGEATGIRGLDGVIHLQERCVADKKEGKGLFQRVANLSIF